MDRLDHAIAQFEDETLPLSLGDRVSLLRNALLLNAFQTIQRIKKHGTKNPVSEEEEYKQVECMKHFKIIESMYNSEVKANKAAGKTGEALTLDFMKQIKEMKGSIGDIIQNIPS